MQPKTVLFMIITVSCMIGGGFSPAGTGAERQASTETIAGWNELTYLIAVAEDRLLTLKGLRTACMMHLAIHDALNTIEPVFERYAYEGQPEPADAAAAITQAAFEIVSSQYPDQVERLTEKLAMELRRVPDGPAKAAGISLGRRCAAGVMAMRDGDRWDAESEYTWHPMAPGVYAEFNDHSGTPEGFVFGAGWAVARPFVLPAPDRFRAPPPPDIDTDEYTGAFEEVQRVGRFQTLARTQDQTHQALWWKDFIENSHNRLARDLAVREHLDIRVAARLFALLNVSIFDAYINVFDNKFHYNHWRPYTAIRWAAHDGNPHTEPDTLWNNTHRHTYAFPSYPSAHGSASAAAAAVLADTFGDDYPFTMYTPAVDIAGPLSGKVSMHPPTRSFESFSNAAMECAMSRVYLGIHFRYDSVEGNRLGYRVGRYVIENMLNRLP